MVLLVFIHRIGIIVDSCATITIAAFGIGCAIVNGIGLAKVLLRMIDITDQGGGTILIWLIDILRRALISEWEALCTVGRRRQKGVGY